MTSFFDEFRDAGRGEWVSGDEKLVLAQEGIPFQVTDVIHAEEGQYGERFILRVLLPDPETGDEVERKLGFSIGTVDSRDRMLREMTKWLDVPGNEPPFVQLEKVGRAYILVRGEAPAKPKARGRK